MRTITLALAAAALLAGCASTQMRQYVGKDIREVMLDAGQPWDAMDMGDGVRAFVYPFGGGTYTFPAVSTTTGTISRSGWLDATTITRPGGTVSMPPCRMTYLTRWNPATQGWVVHDYRIPKELVC